MNTRLSASILGMSLFLLSPTVSRADETYTFSASGTFESQSDFTVTIESPSFVTSTSGTFTPIAYTLGYTFSGCTIVSVEVFFTGTNGAPFIEPDGCGAPDINDFVTDLPASDFGSPGIYTTTGTAFLNPPGFQTYEYTMTVTTTPELGTVDLTLLGLASTGLIFVMRKRMHQGYPRI